MKRWWLVIVLLLSLGANLGLLASRVWQRSPGSGPAAADGPAADGPAADGERAPRFALRASP